MVDRDGIYNRLKEIEEGLEYLKNINIELLKNRQNFILAKYYLQVILEGIFTIGNQIIANNNFRKPATYREILKILAENSIIDFTLAEGLDFAARLRNELVHMYWKASLEQIIEIKENKVVHFEKFVKQILELIK
ncbi:MAG: HepT-like ribonuclease domain-containing protein [Elusimicrobiota bacterium]